jgi:hypothetical protein
LSGVTSSVQTQINAKQATITGGATTIASSNLTVSRALVSDGSGKVAVATTTSTEIGYVNGVTSAIQTQLDGKQASGTYVTNVTGTSPIASSGGTTPAISIANAAADGSTKGAAAFNATNFSAAAGVVNTIQDIASPTVNQTAVGMATSIYNAGTTVTVMDLVYLGSSSTWLEASANAASTSGGLLALSLESKNNGQAMKVSLNGSFVRNDSWSWTPGSTLYVSGTSGQITTTQPSATDAVIRVLGFALTATVIYFNPSVDYITHT